MADISPNCEGIEISWFFDRSTTCKQQKVLFGVKRFRNQKVEG